jgi:hypothetical protein
MNRTLARLTIIFVVLVSTPVLAFPVVTIEGVVAQGDTRLSSTFAATIEVQTDAGDVLVTASLPSLPVLDGFFTIDIDIGNASSAVVDGQTLTVTVDFGDGLESTTRLGSIWRVFRATDADRASVVLVADRLGDIPAADLNADVSPLAVSMAFGNLVGVPPSVADGVDNGNVDALTGLAIGAGVLNVAPGGVTDIAPGTLTGAQLLDGSVTSTELGTLSLAKLQDGTLTGANFAPGAFATPTEVSGVALVFKRPPGCEGSLTTNPVCNRRTCTNQANCTGSNVCLIQCETLIGCENLGPSPSTSQRICVSTGDGFVVQGSLIKDP